MKLIYKGKFNDYEKLPKVQLPSNAKVYDEPDTIEEITKASLKYSLLVLIIPVVIFVAKLLMAGEVNIYFNPLGMSLGIVCALLAIFPHEIIHGLCFPKEAEVEIYQALKKGILFVTSTFPISKRRFIFISVSPNIVFGIIPILIWAFTPPGSMLSAIMCWMGALSLTMSAGDILNIVNTIKQVPKGATIQISGVHTYWYMED